MMMRQRLLCLPLLTIAVLGCEDKQPQRPDLDAAQFDAGALDTKPAGEAIPADGAGLADTPGTIDMSSTADSSSDLLSGDAKGTVTSICVPQSGGGGIPIPCSTAADCINFGIWDKCNLSNLHCGECASDADCAASSKGPRCLVLTNYSTCAECSSDLHCQPGLGTTDTCYNGTCTGCDTDQDCLTAQIGADCSFGVCKACGSDADCTAGPGNTGKCAASQTGCTACDTDLDCTTAGLGVVCNPTSRTCLPCIMNADCVKGVENTGLCFQNECTGCLSQSDCDAAYADSLVPVLCSP